MSGDCTAVCADDHKENTEQIILRLSKEIHLQAECQCEKYWLERGRVLEGDKPLEIE